MWHILDKLNNQGYGKSLDYDKETSNLQVLSGFINRSM
jgi:hypothetical protein